jgi:hypothetical protein
MNFCKLPDDIFVELSKHMTTFSLRKLRIANSQMYNNTVGQECDKRKTEKVFFNFYLKESERCAFAKIKKIYTYPHHHQEDEEMADDDFSDYVENMKNEDIDYYAEIMQEFENYKLKYVNKLFILNNRIYGVNWNMGPEDLYEQDFSNMDDCVDSGHFHKSDVYNEHYDENDVKYYSRWPCNKIDRLDNAEPKILKMKNVAHHRRTKMHQNNMRRMCGLSMTLKYEATNIRRNVILKMLPSFLYDDNGEVNNFITNRFKDSIIYKIQDGFGHEVFYTVKTNSEK